jgi:hypothetical protein
LIWIMPALLPLEATIFSEDARRGFCPASSIRVIA